MANLGLKQLSTKAPQAIPAEFEQVFVEHGWQRANYLFGKRAVTRYFTVLGADRLRAGREAYLRGKRTDASAPAPRTRWT